MNSRLTKWIWFGSLAIVAAAAAVLFLFDPATAGIYPVCLFHRVTGLDCPGCGSLRALHQLLHGHLWTALRLNPFTVLSVPLLGWLALRGLRAQSPEHPAPIVRPLWLWIYLTAWIVFGIARDLPLAEIL